MKFSLNLVVYSALKLHVPLLSTKVSNHVYHRTFHPRGVITNQIFSENQNEGSTDDSINIGGVVDFESYRSP